MARGTILLGLGGIFAGLLLLATRKAPEPPIPPIPPVPPGAPEIPPGGIPPANAWQEQGLMAQYHWATGQWSELALDLFLSPGYRLWPDYFGQHKVFRGRTAIRIFDSASEINTKELFYLWAKGRIASINAQGGYYGYAIDLITDAQVEQWVQDSINYLLTYIPEEDGLGD